MASAINLSSCIKWLGVNFKTLCFFKGLVLKINALNSVKTTV